MTERTPEEEELYSLLRTSRTPPAANRWRTSSDISSRRRAVFKGIGFRPSPALGGAGMFLILTVVAGGAITAGLALRHPGPSPTAAVATAMPTGTAHVSPAAFSTAPPGSPAPVPVPTAGPISPGATSASAAPTTAPIIAPPPTAVVPPPGNAWTGADIGNPALRGSDSLSGGTWTIAGSGTDIYDTSDQFHYVWEPFTGDRRTSAEVLSQTNTSSYAKAGVLMRQSTAANSIFYDVVLKPSGYIEVQYRSAPGAPAVTAVQISGHGPEYLAVSKVGSTYTALTSTNGLTWQPIPGSTVTLGMSGSLLSGMAVTSHNTAAISTARFGSVVF